jgi:two-component system response regulator NreC
MAKTRVLLVDDHAVVRMGVRALLQGEADFDTVGEAASGREAIQEARRLKPDIVIMDITLPDINGLEAMAQIKAEAPDARVVVLTMHEDKDFFFRALQAGAAGYVVKGGDSDNILAALRAVQGGGIFLDPSLAKFLVSRSLKDDENPQVKDLGARELEVLRLIGDGLTNKEIGSRLGLSVTTIETYRTRIMEKLGFHTVVELVRYAIRKGIIQP